MLYNVTVSVGAFMIRFESITGDDAARIIDILDWEPKVFVGNNPGVLVVYVTSVGG